MAEQVGDGRRRATRTTVDAIVFAPVRQDNITVERTIIGGQVRTRYVNKSDGSPVAGLGETWHLGKTSGFDPPAT
jgi:hypothetical protein